MPYKDYELHKQKVKERYWANPEKAKAYSKAYNQRPEVKVRKLEHARKWAATDEGKAYEKSDKRRAQARKTFKDRYPKRTIETKQKALLRIIKKRASDKGLAFDLKHDKIIWPTHCPVFGTQLVYGQRAEKGAWANGASVDRINPLKGYTLDNIVVMSWRANRIKSDATVEDLEKIVSFLRMLRIPKGEQQC